MQTGEIIWEFRLFAGEAFVAENETMTPYFVIGEVSDKGNSGHPRTSLSVGLGSPLG